jgi:hypothetical protein
MGLHQTCWEIDTSLATKSTFRQFQKRHQREYASCFNNLDKIKRLLEAGTRLQEMQHSPSFFRHEGDGIFRIGQSGLTGAKESRLYVYITYSAKVIYIIGIGTKESQKADLALAKRAIRGIGQ